MRYQVPPIFTLCLGKEICLLLAECGAELILACRNVRLAEAPSYGMPITEYDPKSKGAEAYMDFAEEFLELEEE